MPAKSLSTQEVADLVGVPYTTLLKWQTTDRLLRPTLGGGGRRGGDRWSPAEVELARTVARLREADLPVRYVKAVVDALRGHRGGKARTAVYLTVCVREAADTPERRVALLEIQGDAPLRDATQLACL